MRTSTQGPLGLGKLWFPALAAGLILFTAGCQEGLVIGAVNRCGYDIEVTANSNDRLIEEYWTTIGDGQRAYLGTTAESTRELHVWARRSEGGPTLYFQVSVKDLPVPPTGAIFDGHDDVDVEIVIENGHCP